jgi:hypothetical protein
MFKRDLKTLKRRAKLEAKSIDKDWREIYKYYKNLYARVQVTGDVDEAKEYAKNLHLIRHYRDKTNAALASTNVKNVSALLQEFKEMLPPPPEE